MRVQLTEIQRLRQSNTRLKNENKKLREIIKAQAIIIEKLTATIEKQQLEIEELRRIVFGKGKKSKKDKQSNNDSFPPYNTNTKINRSAKSYRRAIPNEKEITNCLTYECSQCPDCKAKLTQIKEYERYVEDLLPISEWGKVLKKIRKEKIKTGYCCNCKKRVHPKKVSSQTVTLGENIRHYLVFASVILRLSYSQIKSFLESTANLKISDGEISKLLEKEAALLEPAFMRLKDNIRGQPGAHYDETSWKVQKSDKGNHAWVMTGTKTTDTVFLLGRSRGKGNLEELQGENNHKQIGISDDYNAYKNAFDIHALCWAHPHRKLRDLKNSGNLSVEKQKHCKYVYKTFARLYAQMREVANTSFNKNKRLKKKKILMKKFIRFAQPHHFDPQKLKQIKKRLLEQKECYFVCLTEQSIPLDNNKAERAIRPLVLKRKNSYGSKTQAGADRMSIIYSVVLSTWWKFKTTFFKKYLLLFN